MHQHSLFDEPILSVSDKPGDREGFFCALAKTEVPADFLGAEDRVQGGQDRDPFEGWEE